MLFRSAMTLWVDRFLPDGKVLDGARGSLCSTHAERLTAPVGWSFEDRRESAPRLFKPRIVESAPSAPPPAAPRNRRERARDLPRPSLFAEPPSPRSPEPPVERAPEIDVAPPPRVAPVVARDEPQVTPIFKESMLQDDSSSDDTGSWVPHFDPDDDLGGVLDATGPMLRDAFRSRHNGRSSD